MSAAGAREAAPLFEPDGVFRRVNREAVLVLSGPRALLLQLAHPLVAQGVADHSDFRRDALGRLWRTLDTMLTIIFAPREEALATAARLRTVHEHVRGRLREDTPAFPAGTPYAAPDPELLRWVEATLLDSGAVAYERWVAPLSPAEGEAYYREAGVLAELLGIPLDRRPPTWRAFRADWAARLAGPELAVTDTARELADAVLHPPLPGIPRALGDLVAPLTLGLLPPRVRAAYGLPWERRHRTAFSAADRLLRTARPWLPTPLRLMPHARRAA